MILVSLATLILNCASVPAVIPDQPQTPEQCFESSFNPFRLATEPWDVLEASPPVYVLKNPNQGQYPKVIIVQVNQWGQVLSYIYLDGKDLVAYGTDGKCYRKMELEPETRDKLKLFILNIAKEKHCEKGRTLS
jgi:hypothetical protein